MQLTKINSQTTMSANNRQTIQNKKLFISNNNIQQDTVSFGMAKLKDPQKLPELLASNKFFADFLKIGSSNAAEAFFKKLAEQPDKIKNDFFLFRDTNRNSPFHGVKFYDEFKFPQMLNVIKKLDPEIQRKWLLLKNGNGDTPLHHMLTVKNNMPSYYYIGDKKVRDAIIDLASNLDIKAQRAFALVQNKDKKSHFSKAMSNDCYDTAGDIIDFVKKLDEKTQKAWIGLNNGAHYKDSLKDNKVANKLLDFMAEKTPKRLLDLEIPEYLPQLDSFILVVRKMASN